MFSACETIRLCPDADYNLKAKSKGWGGSKQSLENNSNSFVLWKLIHSGIETKPPDYLTQQ